MKKANSSLLIGFLVFLFTGCTLLSGEINRDPDAVVSPVISNLNEQITVSFKTDTGIYIPFCGGAVFGIERLVEEKWEDYSAHSGICIWGFRFFIEDEISTSLNLNDEGIYRIVIAYKMFTKQEREKIIEGNNDLFNSRDWEVLYSNTFQIVEE